MMSSYQQKIKNSMPNRPNAGMKQQSVTIKPAFVPTGRDSYKVEFNGGAMQDFAMFKPKLDSRLGSLHYLTHVGARGAMNPGTYQRNETVASTTTGQPSKKQRKQEIPRFESVDSDQDN